MVLAKLDSYMEKNLNISSEIIKILEGNVGSLIFDINLSNTYFCIMSFQPEKQKKKYSKLKAFAQQRKPSAKLKGRLMNERRYLHTIYSIRG